MLDFKNFDYIRIVLYVIFAYFASQLWITWQQEQQITQQIAEQTVAAQAPAKDLPTIQTTASGHSQTEPLVANEQAQLVPIERLVWIETDVLRLAIDTQGGNVVRTELLKFPESHHKPDEPVRILTDDPTNLYIAQSGLLSQRGPDTTLGQARYVATAQRFQLAAGQDQLAVKLQWQDNVGVLIEKTFTFERGKYLINVDYAIHNQSSQDWQGNYYTQIKRKDIEPKKQGMFYINPYRGASYSNPEAKIYNKLPFSKMAKTNLEETVKGGWIAMQQHYFLSAWIPTQNTVFHYYSKAPKENVGENKDKPTYFLLGMYSDTIQVPSLKSHHVGSQLYIGPEQSDLLKAISPGLDMTVDYGILWPIATIIMWLMKKINIFVNNWGWSIILITVLIKLLFYRLSATTYRSMARQKELAPRMEQLRARFGDDKQGFSQAMLELYRKEKVNPLGGCLPMIVQIPVFIALYWVLVESVEFRQAPFFAWIQDLSLPDPFYILPLLMGFTMWIQQKLNPPPPDPMQRKMLMALPVVFTVLFLYFPAGLVLYFTVNNALSVLQQWYVMRSISQPGSKATVIVNKKPN